MLGIETSCDETAAAVVAPGPGGPGRPARSARRWCPARSSCTPPSAAWSPNWPAGPTSSASARWWTRRWPRPGCAGRGGHRGGRRHLRAGPGRGPAGRVERGQGAGPGLGRALRRGEPPRGPPLRLVARGPRPGLAGGGAAGVGRPHPADRDGSGPAATGCSARPSTTPPARPTTRWPATWVSATRAARPSTASPPTATRRPSPSPGRCSTTASTSPSRASRRRWCAPSSATPTRANADVAASFQAAVVDVLVAKTARALDGHRVPGVCLAGGVAANSALRRRTAELAERARGPRLPAQPRPCAPTTRRWWPPPGPGAWSTTARARSPWPPTPNLSLPLGA